MDEKLTCNLSIDKENNKIMITNLQEDNFEIDFSSDIDFTKLVSLLTKKIDTMCEIELEINNEQTDEKIILIINTIEKIFQKYNESLNYTQEEDSEDISF